MKQVDLLILIFAKQVELKIWMNLFSMTATNHIQLSDSYHWHELKMKIAAGYTLNYRMRVFSRTPSWVVWSLHSRCTAMSCQSCSSKKKLCWARQRFSCLAVGTNTSTSSYMALSTLKGIIHPKMNIYSPQAIPDLEKCSITRLPVDPLQWMGAVRMSPNSW